MKRHRGAAKGGAWVQKGCMGAKVPQMNGRCQVEKEIGEERGRGTVSLWVLTSEPLLCALCSRGQP